MIGRLAHIGIDLVLISGVLAGIKRSSGITPNLDLIENKDVRNYAGKYLNFGELFLDSTGAFLGSSQFFTRK
ncbi:uncharacterized protein KGF55_003909 [Candida pseudojiufengensis]|uniref:uncharacterized protein n=1 Tax=Candida pseudojiufengensis TaxID=497109 RepID=UPI0022252E16|nr:uncharacterized protein KGF55_003909 [Candida pseudojiufengensis]KAI5961592.1 hypothetical protein KGF55_003909 [Candida pseudojiufengensis]